MVFQTQARRKDFLFRQIKPSIQPNTNLKLKLAHINKVVKAEMSVVIEVVERIKMEDWVSNASFVFLFSCFYETKNAFSGASEMQRCVFNIKRVLDGVSRSQFITVIKLAQS